MITRGQTNITFLQLRWRAVKIKGKVNLGLPNSGQHERFRWTICVLKLKIISWLHKYKDTPVHNEICSGQESLLSFYDLEDMGKLQKQLSKVPRSCKEMEERGKKKDNKE